MLNEGLDFMGIIVDIQVGHDKHGFRAFFGRAQRGPPVGLTRPKTLGTEGLEGRAARGRERLLLHKRIVDVAEDINHPLLVRCARAAALWHHDSFKERRVPIR